MIIAFCTLISEIHKPAIMQGHARFPSKPNAEERCFREVLGFTGQWLFCSKCTEDETIETKFSNMIHLSPRGTLITLLSSLHIMIVPTNSH